MINLKLFSKKGTKRDGNQKKNLTIQVGEAENLREKLQKEQQDF